MNPVLEDEVKPAVAPAPEDEADILPPGHGMVEDKNGQGEEAGADEAPSRKPCLQSPPASDSEQREPATHNFDGAWFDPEDVLVMKKEGQQPSFQQQRDWDMLEAGLHSLSFDLHCQIGHERERQRREERQMVFNARQYAEGLQSTMRVRQLVGQVSSKEHLFVQSPKSRFEALLPKQLEVEGNVEEEATPPEPLPAPPKAMPAPEFPPNCWTPSLPPLLRAPPRAEPCPAGPVPPNCWTPSPLLRSPPRAEPCPAGPALPLQAPSESKPWVAPVAEDPPKPTSVKPPPIWEPTPPRGATQPAKIPFQNYARRMSEVGEKMSRRSSISSDMGQSFERRISRISSIDEGRPPFERRKSRISSIDEGHPPGDFSRVGSKVDPNRSGVATNISGGRPSIANKLPVSKKQPSLQVGHATLEDSSRPPELPENKPQMLPKSLGPPPMAQQQGLLVSPAPSTHQLSQRESAVPSAQQPGLMVYTAPTTQQPPTTQQQELQAPAPAPVAKPQGQWTSPLPTSAPQSKRQTEVGKGSVLFSDIREKPQSTYERPQPLHWWGKPRQSINCLNSKTNAVEDHQPGLLSSKSSSARQNRLKDAMLQGPSSAPNLQLPLGNVSSNSNTWSSANGRAVAAPQSPTSQPNLQLTPGNMSSNSNIRASSNGGAVAALQSPTSPPNLQLTPDNMSSNSKMRASSNGGLGAALQSPTYALNRQVTPSNSKSISSSSSNSGPLPLVGHSTQRSQLQELPEAQETHRHHTIASPYHYHTIPSPYNLHTIQMERQTWATAGATRARARDFLQLPNGHVRGPRGSPLARMRGWDPHPLLQGLSLEHQQGLGSDGMGFVVGSRARMDGRAGSRSPATAPEKVDRESGPGDIARADGIKVMEGGSGDLGGRLGSRPPATAPGKISQEWPWYEGQGSVGRAEGSKGVEGGSGALDGSSGGKLPVTAPPATVPPATVPPEKASQEVLWREGQGSVGRAEGGEALEGNMQGLATPPATAPPTIAPPGKASQEGLESISRAENCQGSIVRAEGSEVVEGASGALEGNETGAAMPPATVPPAVAPPTILPPEKAKASHEVLCCEGQGSILSSASSEAEEDGLGVMETDGRGVGEQQQGEGEVSAEVGRAEEHGRGNGGAGSEDEGDGDSRGSGGGPGEGKPGVGIEGDGMGEDMDGSGGKACGEATAAEAQSGGLQPSMQSAAVAASLPAPFAGFDGRGDGAVAGYGHGDDGAAPGDGCGVGDTAAVDGCVGGLDASDKSRGADVRGPQSKRVTASLEASDTSGAHDFGGSAWRAQAAAADAMAWGQVQKLTAAAWASALASETQRPIGSHQPLSPKLKGFNQACNNYEGASLGQWQQQRQSLNPSPANSSARSIPQLHARTPTESSTLLPPLQDARNSVSSPRLSPSRRNRVQQQHLASNSWPANMRTSADKLVLAVPTRQTWSPQTSTEKRALAAPARQTWRSMQAPSNGLPASSKGLTVGCYVESSSVGCRKKSGIHCNIPGIGPISLLQGGQPMQW